MAGDTVRPTTKRASKLCRDLSKWVFCPTLFEEAFNFMANLRCERNEFPVLNGRSSCPNRQLVCQVGKDRNQLNSGNYANTESRREEQTRHTGARRSITNNGSVTISCLV